MTDPIRDLWTSQPIAPVRPSPEELDRRARGLDRRVRRRNALEYGAGAIPILVFGAMALGHGDPLMRLASVVIVLGVIFVLYGLHHRAGASRVEDWAAPILDHHRAQLVRQRDALAGVWRWYLAPLVPGLALLFAGVWRLRSASDGIAAATIAMLPPVLIAVVAFAGIHWLNRVAARRLTRAIAALDD
ncbi:MAG: hypothetical protein ACTHM0_14580 [Sphingomonas sp.]